MTNPADPLRNAKDPLHKTGPEAGKELFRRFGQAANEFPRDVVVDAAMNTLLNVIRQAYPNRRQAEQAFDEAVAKTKHVLLEQHYDAMGQRRNVFPYNQSLDVPLINLRARH